MPSITCSVCPEPHYAQGLCKRHYEQQYHHGTITLVRRRALLRERVEWLLTDDAMIQVEWTVPEVAARLGATREPVQNVLFGMYQRQLVIRRRELVPTRRGQGLGPYIYRWSGR